MRSLARYFNLLLPTLVSTLCFAAPADRIGVIDSSQRVALAGSLNPKALPQYDRGAVEPSMKLGYMTLYITPSPSQQQALDQLVAEQQDRKSPNYHKWLTPAQFADRFGLSQNDLTKITAWLTANGFQILSTGGGRNNVIFSGTAAQVQSVFGTEIHRYVVNGEKHFANSSLVQIPAALSGIVTGVTGLHDFRPKPMVARPTAGAHPRRPNYTTTIDESTAYLLAPGDVATIYDINSLYDATSPINGAGETLAIMGQTDIYLADLVDFRNGFGLPSFSCTTGSTGLITSCDSTYFSYILLGTDPGQPSLNDLVEADLDVEWSGAVARNAQIVFVNAETSDGVYDALTYTLDPPSGTPIPAYVVSMSYGACERANGGGFLEGLLEQGTSEGITTMNSAGDTGSAICDYNPPNNNPPFSGAVGGMAVSYPASSQYVTSVGGTAFPLTDFSSSFWGSNGANGGSALTAIIGTEIVWNDDEEFAQYCASTSNPGFCDPSPGVPITSAQTTQEDYWISQGGGGVSNCATLNGDICAAGFARPSWQQNISIPGLTSPQDTYRMVPDVSFLASPNYPGYIICTPVEELSGEPPYDTETSSSCANGIAASADGTVSGDVFVISPSIVGGTSASSPLFAGIVAVISQYLGQTGLGNVNPTLYSLAASNPNAFHTVTGGGNGTSGNNFVYCEEGDPAGQPADVICPSSGATPGVIGFDAANADATTGYNLVAGLGSVDVAVLANAWATSINAPSFTLATTNNFSPTSIPAGQSAAATLTVAPVNGSTQTVSFSCSGQPAGVTCSFNPTSVTLDGTDSVNVTLTISTAANMTVPTGQQTFNAVGASGNRSFNTPVNVTITATNQTFSLAATNGATFNVTVGGSTAVNLAITGTNSFTSGTTTALPLTYTCTGSPSLASAEIACQVPTPTNATSVTVTLVTTAATSVRHRTLGSNRTLYPMLLPGLFGILFLAGGRRRGLRVLSLIAVLSFSTLWLGSCGSGGSGGNGTQNQGTPPGSYTITIGATTGGSVPLSNSNAPYTVTLIVSAP